MTAQKNTATYTKEHYIQQMQYICNCISAGIPYKIREIIVDNFAGGGGASTGIEIATGRSVDIAINHDIQAIRMHKANHPSTKHYCESVYDINPLEVCKGRPVGLVWLSPDCKHFSKAKGGTPVEKSIRGLAWISLRWASLVRPRVIMLENVEEFKTWGPLRAKRDPKTGRVLVKEYEPLEGKCQQKKYHIRVAAPGEIVPQSLQVMEPDPNRKGRVFRKFVKSLESLGYSVEYKELIAADYGAPTMRKRFFLIARCDKQAIVWPEATHAPRSSKDVTRGFKLPYVGAYTQIDFSRPCPSIFASTKEIKEQYGIKAIRPLAPKTMERIAKGIQKFVIENEEPFIVQVNHSGSDWNYCRSMNEPLPVITSKHGFGIVEPILSPYKEEESSAAERQLQVASFIHQYYSGGYTGSGNSVEKPLPTITAWDHNSLCVATLIQMNNHCYGRDIAEPLPTITAGDGHFGEVRAFLIKYYGQGTGQALTEPLDTVTSHDKFGLVTIKGTLYKIVDIGLRMLEPSELYGCNGFPSDYIIDRDYEGKTYPRTEQVHRCGNAVCPPIPAALVKANLPSLCIGKRMPNMRITTEQTGQLCFA